MALQRVNCRVIDVEFEEGIAKHRDKLTEIEKTFNDKCRDLEYQIHQLKKFLTQNGSAPSETAKESAYDYYERLARERK